MRIARQERLRPAMQVGEVAAAAAGYADLLGELARMLDQQHAPAPLPGLRRAHHAGRASADDDDVEIHFCNPRAKGADHSAILYTAGFASTRPTMLSYRHAFHAGNHADVLKHIMLVQLLHYLNQKGKPYWFIDTHAGAGTYSLTKGYAMQVAEFKDGIARLWQRDDLPAAVTDYLEVIRAANPDGALRHYPGSPRVALAAMRATDRLRLFELHPTDCKLLARNLADAGRRALIHHADGLAGLKALLPPPPRRALTLIDPSYEVKTDYQHVVQSLRDALMRFPGGVYALWYPLLARTEAQKLPGKLRLLQAKSWLDLSLRVKAPSPDGIGMHGSGMFIINPPHTLRATLNDVLPWLAQALAQDEGAGFALDSHET